ncbi:MAG: class I SAM-dependent methyltransferase [Betaproteobacteria bacterium]|nr:class I SAM-dependent methyltransferase [Betaproteobacteria bacterium]
MTKSTFAPQQPFASSGFETRKFAHRREPYWASINAIKQLAVPAEDLIHHYPAFAGHVCLARHLALYEAYKLTIGLAGHIAEAGVWKGSSLLLLAKLTQLFEPESLVQTHGFDWFRGNHPTEVEKHLVAEGSYFASQEDVQALIDLQNLGSLAMLHNVDLSKDLDVFFRRHDHLYFKLVFLDCGLYDVVSHCIDHFWPRLNPGGILLLDNFNHETAPGETRAVMEKLPGHRIHTFPFAQQPTAYIVKPSFDNPHRVSSLMR